MTAAERDQTAHCHPLEEPVWELHNSVDHQALHYWTERGCRQTDWASRGTLQRKVRLQRYRAGVQKVQPRPSQRACRGTFSQYFSTEREIPNTDSTRQRPVRELCDSDTSRIVIRRLPPETAPISEQVWEGKQGLWEEPYSEGRPDVTEEQSRYRKIR